MVIFGRDCDACGHVAAPGAAASCPLGDWCALRIVARARAELAAARPPHEAVDTGLTPMTGDFRVSVAKRAVVSGDEALTITLHTAAPPPAGPDDEVGGSGYARAAVAFPAPAWPAVELRRLLTFSERLRLTKNRR